MARLIWAFAAVVGVALGLVLPAPALHGGGLLMTPGAASR
jgi:hypothetical protein